MYRTGFNPSDAPVMYAESGATVGGGEWATLDTTDPVAKAAIDAGRLVLTDFELDEDSQDPAAVAVQEQTARAEKLRQVPKDVLVDLAEKNDLADGDDHPTRSELESTLAQEGVEPPKATRKKSASRQSTDKN